MDAILEQIASLQEFSKEGPLPDSRKSMAKIPAGIMKAMQRLQSTNPINWEDFVSRNTMKHFVATTGTIPM